MPPSQIRNLSLSLVLLLTLNQCALFRGKSIDSPLADFYKQSPPAHTQAALRITEKGREELKDDQYDVAIEKLNRALVIDPYNPFAYYFLALANYKQQQHRKSLGFLTKAKQFSRPFPFWRAQSYHLTGLNWKALGNIKRANFHFKKARQLGPKIDFETPD